MKVSQSTQENAQAGISIRSGVLAGALTVYGSPKCGWTTKQLKYLEDKGISHKFVDCTKTQCPSFVSAFPTLDRDGKISVGYQEIKDC